MADVKAAREEVQKVVAFLTNRFGYQEDVFKHLTLALAHLQDDPPPREEVPVAVEPPAEAETVAVADEEAVFIPVSEEAVAEPEPEPRVPRRSRGKRSRK